jgi:undecaprenyl diphosphate synthase
MDGVGTSPLDAALRHVLLVGGSVDEWNLLTEQQWHERLTELGKIADHVGAQWLMVRPYTPGPGGVPRQHQQGVCTITVVPDGGGRSRFVDAVAALQAGGAAITEQAIAAIINAPALCDADLVVILGPSDRMPPALAWELAYSELVFVDVAWADLQAAHLEQSISAFARRHRRFGGLD